ncbi:DNA-binding protein [Streptomyces caelestis]|uniref:DNA-binding protein n=1 Tax=Streptomyces caelestis TaxID=36816 RepID=UPI003652D483
MSGAPVLDSEGLAKAVQRDRAVHGWLTAAREADLPVITSASVPVEVIRPRINDAALRRTLSRLRVEPVTRALARSAAALLRAAGPHGRRYAVDAMLCATAPHHPGRGTVLISDVEDIGLLTAAPPRVTAEKA